jgi:hypothetical protein
MRWVREQCWRWRLFHYLTGIHDGNAVGSPRNDAEVVGNKQNCHSAPASQVVEHLEDLSLDRYIECRGRFIGD